MQHSLISKRAVERGAALAASDSNSLSIRRVELKGYNTTSINVDGTNVAIGFQEFQLVVG